MKYTTQAKPLYFGKCFLKERMPAKSKKTSQRIVEMIKKQRSFKAYEIAVDYQNSKNTLVIVNMFREFDCIYPPISLVIEIIYLRVA